MSTKPEHATYSEWLDQQLDGCLASELQGPLATHLEGCTECRREEVGLRQLHGLIGGNRVPVRAGFEERVLAALPSPPWRQRVGRPGILALVLTLALIVAAGMMLTLSQPSSPQSILSALADFSSTALVAGAGMLGASWRGVGMAVDDFLGQSLPNLLLSLFIVIALNGLLLRLLLRRSRAAVGARCGSDHERR